MNEATERTMSYIEQRTRGNRNDKRQAMLWFFKCVRLCMRYVYSDNVNFSTSMLILSLFSMIININESDDNADYGLCCFSHEDDDVEVFIQ